MPSRIESLLGNPNRRAELQQRRPRSYARELQPSFMLAFAPDPRLVLSSSRGRHAAEPGVRRRRPSPSPGVQHCRSMRCSARVRGKFRPSRPRPGPAILEELSNRLHQLLDNKSISSGAASKSPSIESSAVSATRTRPIFGPVRDHHDPDRRALGSNRKCTASAPVFCTRRRAQFSEPMQFFQHAVGSDRDQHRLGRMGARTATGLAVSLRSAKPSAALGVLADARGSFRPNDRQRTPTGRTCSRGAARRVLSRPAGVCGERLAARPCSAESDLPGKHDKRQGACGSRPPSGRSRRAMPTG